MADNKKLQETLKSLLYAGVGYAAKTSERVTKNVEDLVKKGKINEREGKKIVDHVVTNAEAKRKELEGKLNKVVDKYGKAGINQVQGLTKKIQKLETELQKRVKLGGAKPAAKPAAAPKKAAKKAAPKKATKKAPAKKAVSKAVKAAATPAAN
jgi:polyhydroxyalkanoate synthesis regulator phasin